MYKYHPPIYYTVRSVVRWVFWTSVYFLFVVGLGMLLNRETKPYCDVDLFRNFTWSADKNFDLNKCAHPYNVLLLADGTWIWKN